MSDIRDALQHQLGPTYTVERELGGGGMSRVFVAHDQALNRRIAVKVVSPELAASVHLERFMREILVAATLQNPHIVGVLAAGEVDGLPYFTMPFIEGESLRARMVAAGPMPVREVVTVLRDVARALAYAHERGIVHRDIKPDNVLLASGSAMVTDFGVAKAVLSAQRTPSGPRSSVLTQVGTTVGTPAYMAPEQIAADPDVDARADLYSFGVMAYEMLAGGPPFASLTPQALLAAHLAKPPRPLDEVRPDLPPRLVSLVMRCLEKERTQRPQSAREIVDALDDPAIVSTDSLPATRRARARRRLTGVLVALVLVAAGATAAIVTIRGRPEAALPASNPDSLRAHSVLVMPFVNQGSDSADQTLADGITTELVNALTRVPGLRVASVPPGANGAMPYRTQQQLGTAYNVGFVLEGTVQKQGDSLRIAASLVNTTDGFIAWSDMYNPTIRDIFAVQQGIAVAIATALEPRLAVRPQMLADRGTKDATAYEAYTRAAGFISRPGARALRRAIDTLGWAVGRDSNFAKAYAATAHAYALLPTYDPAPSDSLLSLGIAAATRAIALDSTLADAYSARASLFRAEFRWTEAERDYRKAISIDPRAAAPHQGLGEILLLQGRVPEAVEQLRRATALDQTSAGALASYAMALSIAGDQTAALAAARRAMVIDSTTYVTQLALGVVQAFAGHADSALGPLEAAGSMGTRRHPTSSAVNAMLAYTYARVGDMKRAEAIAKAAAADRNPDAAVISAHALLGAGDTAGALAALDSAARAHAPLLSAESLAEPIFDPIRAHPKFLGVLQKLGLPDSLAQLRTPAS